MVGYEDGGIDLRDDWGVTNVPDLRISQVVGDKGIRSITIEGEFAYLASAVGIVVLDLTKQKLPDTWGLMPSTVQVDARCMRMSHEEGVVGTDLGVLAADQNDPFLANPDRWDAWEPPIWAPFWNSNDLEKCGGWRRSGRHRPLGRLEATTMAFGR